LQYSFATSGGILPAGMAAVQSSTNFFLASSADGLQLNITIMPEHVIANNRTFFIIVLCLRVKNYEWSTIDIVVGENANNGAKTEITNPICWK
jgi:hypothetical protein